QTICGVTDEVAHVSMMSGSPTKPPGLPRCAAVKPGGTSVDGSIGSASSGAAIGRSYSTRPLASIGYHTGNGTPKNRWRLTHQSPFKPSAQFSYRTCM